jgi:DNA repair exonuclease SbcCD ATPase subunit
VLATRTETLEKELDRRARQIEARTEELGERTAGLKEREERFDRLQRVALAAILSELKASVDDLDSRVGAGFFRFFNKTEARRDADSLRQRIGALAAELRDMNTEQAKKMIEQLDALSKKVDAIAVRIK